MRRQPSCVKWSDDNNKRHPFSANARFRVLSKRGVDGMAGERL